MSLLRDRVLEGKSKEGRFFNKHTHFAEIYEKMLTPFIGKSMNLVELGISHGGSLQLWREFLGENVRIYGFDVADHTLYQEPQIECHQLDQANTEALKKIRGIVPNIDLFIDDGSHYSRDQIQTFEEVFPLINPGGIYVCEDTHTSYRELYNGGYKQEDTFIEYCKNIVDSMYKNESEKIIPNKHFNLIDSIQFYFAMVVIRRVP